MALFARPRLAKLEENWGEGGVVFFEVHEGGIGERGVSFGEVRENFIWFDPGGLPLAKIF